MGNANTWECWTGFLAAFLSVQAIITIAFCGIGKLNGGLRTTDRKKSEKGKKGLDNHHGISLYWHSYTNYRWKVLTDAAQIRPDVPVHFAT